MSTVPCLFCGRHAQDEELDKCYGTIGELSTRVAQLLEETDQLRQSISELERERDHWKANHDNQVERARVLIDRPDMPLERVQAYKFLTEAQATIAAQAHQIVEQQEKLSDIKGCFDAAFAEGLWERLNEGGEDDSSWYGLFSRRLVYAYQAVEYQNFSALAAHDAKRRKEVLEEVKERAACRRIKFREDIAEALDRMAQEGE